MSTHYVLDASVVIKWFIPEIYWEQASLLQMPVQIHPWQDLLLEAGQVAHQTYRSVYDCLYLVLAKQINGKMVTADKFYLALENSKEWARYLLWIEDVRT